MVFLNPLAPQKPPTSNSVLFPAPSATRGVENLKLAGCWKRKRKYMCSPIPGCGGRAAYSAMALMDTLDTRALSSNHVNVRPGCAHCITCAVLVLV